MRSGHVNSLYFAAQTENPKTNDKRQELDDYGKQEADAREKQDIDFFEKPIINQHYTGLSRAMPSYFEFLFCFITLSNNLVGSFL